MRALAHTTEDQSYSGAPCPCEADASALRSITDLNCAPADPCEVDPCEPRDLEEPTAEHAQLVGESTFIEGSAAIAQTGIGAPLSDAEFKVTLTQVIPQLRAFGRSLSGSRDLADDLVQETLMKAWEARARFQAGTNMRAWTFIILRNFFLSQMRRARFHGDWDDLVAERVLAAPSSQEKHVELGDLQRALMCLPTSQREALVLVGAGGFAYEEAAEICGVAVGTIKSRVARGRVALEALMSGNGLSARCTHTLNQDGESPFDAIMGGVNQLSHGK